MLLPVGNISAKKLPKNDAHNMVGINDDFRLVNETTCDISNLF